MDVLKVRSESLPRHRRVYSYRLDPEIADPFNEWIRGLGLSTCMVLESCMRAVMTGQVQGVPMPRPVTVNMTVNRIVERPRRGRTEFAFLACSGLDHRPDLPGTVGWCRRIKKWRHMEDCEACPAFQE